MFLGSVSGTRRPEPWLSQPGDGYCFYFSLLSGVCTYIPTNSTSPDSAPISPFAVPQHKARPKTTVATGEMLQFPKRRTFVCCVFQASLNNAFCKYTAAVSWKQAIKPPPLLAPSPLPCPPNRTQQWPCSGMWRWPPRCRLAEECRHHHKPHTHPPRNTKRLSAEENSVAIPFFPAHHSPSSPLPSSSLLLLRTNRVIVPILPRAAKAFRSLSRETTGKTMGGREGRGVDVECMALMMAVGGGEISSPCSLCLQSPLPSFVSNPQRKPSRPKIV